MRRSTGAVNRLSTNRFARGLANVFLHQLGLGRQWPARRKEVRIDEQVAFLRIFPGNGIQGEAISHRRITRNQEQVLAAFRAGSDGVILSRKWSEMKSANLKGAGLAIQQLGLV